VTSTPPSTAAILRGTAAGALTAALAVAAHGFADGATPSGAAVPLLAVLAATVGALAATTARAAETGVLLGLLALGQLVGHVMLTAVGHGHTSTAPPVIAMLVAHVLAVAVGAALIAAGDRLCRAVSRAVEVTARPVAAPISAAPALATAGADQPLRSALLLAASVSHRGPPVSPAR
jgi:hypothetical protein